MIKICGKRVDFCRLHVFICYIFIIDVHVTEVTFDSYEGFSKGKGFN